MYFTWSRIKGDQFHSAVYPRPIVLSAGMSYTLPIVFKPRRKVLSHSSKCIMFYTVKYNIESQ